MSLFSFDLLLFNPIILVSAVIVIVFLVKKNKEYKGSAYYQVTKHSYLSVRYNTGRYGEYLTYKHLKHMEENGAKFLFNVYIPKANGETTEIDMLMICPKGIFVFESKNYSGWIFGNEKQKNWYQTLPIGRGRSHKERFYNPVMQNRFHIKHLQTFLGKQFSMRSIIVFSDRCTLKSVEIYSNDVHVINRYNVNHIISAICDQTPSDLLSASDISEIYNKLYRFTQVDEFIKTQHIANIHNNLNGRPVPQVPQVPPVPTIPIVQKTETTEPVTTTDSVSVPADSSVVDAVESPIEIVEPKPVMIPQQPAKCPWCNGNLILRTATRGVNAGNQFYGCSNYPKCKYIQNIENKTV